jgi:hypothetical protein
MSGKVPVPGTGMEVSSNDGMSGIVTKVVAGGVGFFLLFIMLALGAIGFSKSAEAAGQNPDVDVPVV